MPRTAHLLPGSTRPALRRVLRALHLPVHGSREVLQARYDEWRSTHAEAGGAGTASEGTSPLPAGGGSGGGVGHAESSSAPPVVRRAFSTKTLQEPPSGEGQGRGQAASSSSGQVGGPSGGEGKGKGRGKGTNPLQREMESLEKQLQDMLASEAQVLRKLGAAGMLK